MAYNIALENELRILYLSLIGLIHGIAMIRPDLSIQGNRVNRIFSYG